MSDIAALEQRLTAALDRIASGVDGLSQGADDAEVAALRAALDDEKTVNAQLEERVKTINKRQADAIEAARVSTEAAEARVGQLDLELQRLRNANAQLRDTVDALRKANEANVGEPHLINKAMLTELEALRAERSADVAEASQIIGAF